MSKLLDQYAAKWATAEHQGTKRPSDYIGSAKSVFFEWARDDKDSPVAKLMSVGVSEDTVKSLFDNAFKDQLELLRKLDAQ